MATKKFTRFAGVDFSCDPSMVSDERSPDALNMIPDKNFLPEKRCGWEVMSEYEGRTNGIYFYDDEILVHAGDKFYRGETLLKSGINDDKSCGCIFCGKLYILTGSEFLVYDGDSVKNVKEVATSPQVLSQADNYLRGGVPYQPFNMLTTRRKVGITIPDGGMNVIYIDQDIKDDFRLYFKDTGRSLNVTGTGQNDGRFYIELGENYQPKGVGDMVILEYELSTPKEEIIEKCRIITTFENRLFVAGNPEYPNCDFYSQLGDGNYFADINYTHICGAEEGKEGEYELLGEGIVSYSKVGQDMVVHKKGGGVYLRRGQLTENGMIFPVTQGAEGSVVTTHFCSKNLKGDPLFLTRDGVYGISTGDITKETTLQCRSHRINKKLLSENLNNATACVWRDFYMVFTGERVYLADSRQKSYEREFSNEFQYEWYLWDNVPARVCGANDDILYFGTYDGKLCRFTHKYNDNGEAIYAHWSTKMDDQGGFNTEKILTRRGSGVYLKTFDISSAKLIVRTERDFGVTVNEKNSGIFNFGNINFGNFTFNTLPVTFMPLGRKIKNYRMLQLVLKNDKPDETFGIIGIELRYKAGNLKG